jgi:hypothetical protein
MMFCDSFEKQYLQTVPPNTAGRDPPDSLRLAGTRPRSGEMVDRPRRWNVAFIRNFMIVFGLISSAFDYLTNEVAKQWFCRRVQF